jgi:hypothetical protein
MYLKMTSLLKVTGTLKRMARKTQAADTGLMILTFCTCDVYLFLSSIIQIIHNQRNNLKDNWSTLEQFFMALYGNNGTAQIPLYTEIFAF